METKKGALSQEKIVVIILTVLILAVILWWLFGARIQNWIYNLPSYNVPKEDTEIDISGQSDVGIDAVYEEKCFEYCKNFGECKEKGEIDEINVGQMDCGTNKECYVKKNIEILKSGNLVLKDFYYTQNGEKKNFLGKNEIGFIEGNIEVISSHIEFNNNFCYSLKYNGDAIIKKYSEKNTGDITFGWSVKKGVLEMVAWNPKGNEFVIKRVEIKSLGLPNGYANGRIIENKNFKKEVLNSKNGDILYVFGLSYDWGSRIGTSNYKIEVGDKELKIYILGEFFEKEEKWFLLDCHQWIIGEGIKIDKIKDSLSETLKSCNTW